MLPALYRTYPGLRWTDIETMPPGELTAVLADLAVREAVTDIDRLLAHLATDT